MFLACCQRVASVLPDDTRVAMLQDFDTWARFDEDSAQLLEVYVPPSSSSGLLPHLYEPSKEPSQYLRARLDEDSAQLLEVYVPPSSLSGLLSYL